MTTGVRRLGRPDEWVMRAAGMGFCLVWACAVAVFPLRKRMLIGYVPVALGLAVGAILCRRGVRATLNGRLRSLSAPAFWVFVILVALTLRLAGMAALLVPPGSDSAMYHGKAMDLLTGKGYGHTAYWPPGLPFLLAGWYWLSVPHWVAGYLLGLLLGVGAVGVAYDVGRRALGTLGGRWAAVLMAVCPTLVLTSARADCSSVLTLLVLAIADLMLLATRSGVRGWAAVLALGLVLGFGSLVKPVLLPGPAIALVAWMGLGLGLRAAGKAAVCAVIMACVVAPWTIRNYLVMGGFVPVSTNGGINLYNGSNPRSDGLYSRVEPLPGEVGELASDRVRREAAIRWIRQHPLQWVRLMGIKQLYMWGTSSTTIAGSMNPSLGPGLASAGAAGLKAMVNAFWVVLLVLCLRATFTTPVWAKAELRPLLLVLLYLFLVHLVFEVQSRYHIPVISALVMLSSRSLVGHAGQRTDAGPM